MPAQGIAEPGGSTERLQSNARHTGLNLDPGQRRPQNPHWDLLIRTAEDTPKKADADANGYLFPDIQLADTEKPNFQPTPNAVKGQALISQMEELGRAVQLSSPNFFIANQEAVFALQEQMEAFLAFCQDDDDARGSEWYARLSRLVVRQGRVLERISGLVGRDGAGPRDVRGVVAGDAPQRDVPGTFPGESNAGMAGRSTGPVRGTFAQPPGQGPSMPLPVRRIMACSGTAKNPVELYRRQASASAAVERDAFKQSSQQLPSPESKREEKNRRMKRALELHQRGSELP